MNEFTVARWVFIVALSYFCLDSIGAHAATVEVCNDGDITVKTAAINTTNPFFSGTTYYVAGWYNVEPGKCTTVSDAGGLVNGSYLGFAYADPDGILRTHIAMPSAQNSDVQPSSARFCVATDRSFEYSTTVANASCAAGYVPLTFSLYLDFSSIHLVRVTYTVTASRDEDGDPIGGAAEVAQMLFGEKVHRAGSSWQYEDGKPLSDSLVSDKAPLPPIAPRVQFLPTQQPVAGYVQQIERVVAGVGTCRHSSNETYKQLHVTVDGRGVAVSTVDEMQSAEQYAMLLVNMDFENASIRQYSGGKEFEGECWTLEIPCKSRIYDYCGEHRYDLKDGTRSLYFEVYTNTRDQAARIVDALKRIAPSYPDGKPEITKLQ